MLDGEFFFKEFHSFFDRKRHVRFKHHLRHEDLISTNAENPQVKRMMRFTGGFLKMHQEGTNLWITDLRMGQEPAYVFNFDIGPTLASGQLPPPAKQRNYRTNFGPALRWLGRRILGEDLDPPTT